MKLIDNEIQIIHRAQKGDQKAFEMLYNANVVSLFRFMKQFSKDSVEVEEWVQRSFIKAYEHLTTFRGDAKFSSWLFRLGLNEMKMDRRRFAILPIDNSEIDEMSLKEQNLDQFDWNEMMKAWLGELDENKRMVFLLYEIEGYSHSEIAEMLGFGESTSRTILTRAKQQLKEKWKMEVKGS